ncbi:MAG: alpha-L-fucosidase [Bacteroidota bacterium]
MSTLLTLVFIVGHMGVHAQKKYSPDIASLAQYETPEWFKDAKFGIFIHWGAYSVQATHGEWYPRAMYRENTREYKHHVATYGHPSVFGYKDFIPMLTGKNWNPDSWAKLFADSGAKYVVPVAEHHDGFPMYDCSFSRFNAFEMGPERDVVGELLESCRKLGLKAGVSSHRAFHWEFYRPKEGWENSIPAYQDLYWKKRTTRWPDEDFISDWYLRTLELAVKYKPDIFWFDFFLDQPEMHDARYLFAADYYNLADSWNKEVVLQYKYDTYDPSIGVLDIERGKLRGIQKKPWQTDTSVSFRGWGYKKVVEYKTPQLLIHDLVDIVSKNGNLLLNVGPRPDGIIPKEQADLLLAIGQWLQINGAAIYGTRPWTSFGEGPTKTEEGAHQERKNKEATAKDYRFTRNGNTLYATCLGWPENDFQVESLGSNSTKKQGLNIKEISILGSDETLKWSQRSNALSVSKPSIKPCEHAYVLKIEVDGLEKQMTGHYRNQPEEPTTVYCFPGNSLRDKEGYTVRDGNLNNWEKDIVIRWNLEIKEPGTYQIVAKQKNIELERYILNVNNKEFRNKDRSKENKPQEIVLGKVAFKRAGIYPVTLKADSDSDWKKKLSLKYVKFTKANLSENLNIEVNGK